MSLNRQQREFAERHPAPIADPVARLLHVLDVYADQDDARMVVTATNGIYPGQPQTGLTMGDLRALAARLGVRS